MWLAESPWQLPSTYRLLEQAASSRFEGGAWVVVDRHCPRGLPEALLGALRGSGSDVVANFLADWQGMLPAQAIADAWGVRSDDLAALAGASALTDHALVVDLRDADQKELEAWKRFMRRLGRAMADMSYWALLVVSHEDADVGFPKINGRSLLRRLDARLWAGLRLRAGLEPPMDVLAESLAVELGCLDLEFISRIVGAGFEQLLDPKRHLHDEWRRCVLARGEDYSLAGFESAAWRAQVQALFPWLEDRRHELVARHGKWLAIDNEQVRLNVGDVGQIELGGIAHQLSARVPVQERDYLWALARVRNALAHRCLAPSSDLELALRVARRGG